MANVKDPNAVKDFALDVTEWLAGDTITGTPTWTVPSGITKDSQSNTTTTATVWLSGGTEGTTYELVCRIVTTGGRTEDFSLSVLVRSSAAAKTYGAAAEVAALTPRYASSGAFTSTTRPTAGQVEKWIERVSALLNVLLAEQNFNLPVTQADAVLALEQFVVTQVADLCNYANSAGRFFSDKAATTGPWQAIQKEAAEFIAEHAPGFEKLGATRTTEGLSGLDFNDVDDAGDEILPMFSRKQFSNSIPDWGGESD